MVLKFKAIVKGDNVPEFLPGLGKGVVLEQEVELKLKGVDKFSDVQIALCISQMKANILRDNFEITVEEVK